MAQQHSIQYLQRHQLDDDRWNACINNAANGLIYGYSFYLDAMAGNWDALVLDDYTAVMPLPWRKKWSLYYLYQPFLTAQLGVFGSHLTQDLFAAFLQAVPGKFRYWDFSFNHHNLFFAKGFPFFQRLNYVLPLQQPYEQLRKAYRENIRRNVKKSSSYGNVVATNINLEAIRALAALQAKTVAGNEWAAFAKLMQQLQAKSMSKTYGILSAKGDLLASAVFLFSHNRAYYLLVGNHPNGRTLGASHALIDAFIHDHAAQNLVLDFEGSDMRNLAFFYSSFGAREERYAAIRLNRLPWWAKWAK